jgi:hypothetical protein
MRKRMAQRTEDAQNSLYLSVSKEEVNGMEQGRKVMIRTPRKKQNPDAMLRRLLFTGTIIALTSFIAFSLGTYS